jgi:hypothetical protein
MAFKIASFSLDPETIARLETVCTWLHIKNKSKVLTYLIDREYKQLKLSRETAEETDQ